jgi:hypothetical protein
MLFLRNFLQAPVNTALLNPNILLGILVSNNNYCVLEPAYPVCQSVTQFLWADVDMTPQVRLRQSTYASVPLNYLPALLKLGGLG